jgi:hypothetical protein
MSNAGILLTLGLTLLVALVVALPLLTNRAGQAAHQAYEQMPALVQLQTEREAVLDSLRALDFDHETGKLDPADYAHQRAYLVARGVAILRQLEEGKAEG